MAIVSPDEGAVAPARAGTVLVVDDEAMIRTMARRILERLGYPVLVAEHGRHALEVFRAHASEIGLVILDMTMPIMSGPACFDGLQALDPRVRVLLSSGYASTSETEALLARGAAGVIHKPYSLQTFADAVASVMLPSNDVTALSR